MILGKDFAARACDVLHRAADADKENAGRPDRMRENESADMRYFG